MLQTVSTEDKIQSLNDWLRAFAIEAGESSIQLGKDVLLKAAVSTSFELPGANLDQEEVLDFLGMAVVCQYGQEHIAWIGARSEAEAERLLQKYEKPPYSLIRKFLGIQCLWIIIVNLKEGFYKSRDIFETYVEYNGLTDKPECLIIEL